MTKQFEILKELIVKSKCKIIALDGYKNVGKTTLSNALSKATGFEVIHLDEYRNGIDYHEDEIHEKIKRASQVIVDGVESMKLCEEYTSVFKVYIDNDFCNSSTAREITSVGKENNWGVEAMREFIEKEKRDLPFVDISLDERLINYFVDYRPFEKYDFIFAVQNPQVKNLATET